MGRPSVLRIEVLTDASKGIAGLDRVESRLGGFAKTAGKAAAAGAAAVAVGVGVMAVQSVQAASRVEQAFGGVDKVFGKFAGSAKAAAEGAATSVGLAKAEYGELATILGSQLKNMGTAADQLQPKTAKLIGLGADLAATFGGSTADAVSAVSSLLKGERDPIERYGVSIKQADIDARLAAQGLDKLTGAAKVQATTQATLALLTEQTSAAQGAFAAEGDTLAGQQQRLGAVWENLKATVGAGLLPVLTQFGSYLLTNVVPAAQLAGVWLRDNLAPAFDKVGTFITTRVVPAAAAFLSWFVDRIVPGLRGYVMPILDGLRGAWARISQVIDDNGPGLQRIGDRLRVLAEFIANKVAPVVGTTLGFAFRTMGETIGTAIAVFVRVEGAVEAVIRTIGRLIDKLRDNALVSGIGKVAGIFSSSTVDADALARARGGGPPGGGVFGGGGWGGGGGGLVSAVNLRGGDVTVLIDGQAVRHTVRRELRTWERGAARRVALGRA